MDQSQDILISIGVITYNSAATVIETLDSIASQTYPHLELIISDDCSKDDTVDICRQWIEVHKDRFERTELLTVDKNTGVPGNFNRAEAACRGEWVKEIAGDDLLMPNCIETFVSFAASHPEYKFIFSEVDIFTDTDDVVYKDPFDYSFFELSVEEQYKRLVIEGNCLPAPTFFYNRIAAKKVGLKNDERIRSFEDWPKWVYLTKKHIKFGFIEHPLVRYRLISSSITHTKSNAFDESYERFFYYYLYEPMCKFCPEKRKMLRGMYYSAIRKYRFSMWAIIKLNLYKLLHRFNMV